MKEETLKGADGVSIFMRSWQPAGAPRAVVAMVSIHIAFISNGWANSTAGSKDKTIRLYEGHFHDLLNDLDKEMVMNDIQNWIDARLPARQEAVATTSAGQG